ncbi:MAG: ABC transporter permease subunit [Clostridia bacterium]|nr:ABC transporter permease subunit [Clostridia bacterium]
MVKIHGRLPKKNHKKALRIVKGLAVLAFWLCVWWLAAAAVDREFLLPAPAAVAGRFLALVSTADFWLVTGASLLRIVAGFLLGMLAGVALAALVAKSKLAYALCAPFIKAVRATPVASFIILALIWIAGARLPIFIAFLMVLPVAWANTLAGIEHTDRQLLEMAAVFKVKKSRIRRQIYWPSLRPYVVAAATTGLGLAWKSGITAEVIAQPKLAIGSEVQAGKVYLETADVFVWTAVVIALSLLLERLLLLLVKRGSS